MNQSYLNQIPLTEWVETLKELSKKFCAQGLSKTMERGFQRWINQGEAIIAAFTPATKIDFAFRAKIEAFLNSSMKTIEAVVYELPENHCELVDLSELLTVHKQVILTILDNNRS